MRGNPLAECLGFEWEEWNSGQIWERHRVTPEEAEDIFFRDPCLVRGDRLHSVKEARYGALGQTARGRRLFVAFTVRKKLIRVISARDMNGREDEEYRRYEEKDS
jgi:uncharacterized DUF497 family protein